MNTTSDPAAVIGYPPGFSPDCLYQSLVQWQLAEPVFFLLYLERVDMMKELDLVWNAFLLVPEKEMPQQGPEFREVAIFSYDSPDILHISSLQERINRSCRRRIETKN